MGFALLLSGIVQQWLTLGQFIKTAFSMLAWATFILKEHSQSRSKEDFTQKLLWHLLTKEIIGTSNQRRGLDRLYRKTVLQTCSLC